MICWLPKRTDILDRWFIPFKLVFSTRQTDFHSIFPFRLIARWIFVHFGLNETSIGWVTYLIKHLWSWSVKIIQYFSWILHILYNLKLFSRLVQKTLQLIFQIMETFQKLMKTSILKNYVYLFMNSTLHREIFILVSAFIISDSITLSLTILKCCKSVKMYMLSLFKTDACTWNIWNVSLWRPGEKSHQ